MEKYVDLAKQLKMVNAVVISPKDICFDIRTVLKCKWGCEGYLEKNLKCNTRETTLQERMEMIRKYNHILLVRSHDARELSKTLLELEKAAFLDGYYFAFAVRYCNLCKNCKVDLGEWCPTPLKVRPCEQIFGIDVYKTVKGLGLPCEVLKNKNELQNRYGFVLID